MSLLVFLFVLSVVCCPFSFFFFFFNDTATTEIYTLSLHDALPIYAADSVAELPLRSWLSRCPFPAPACATRLRATRDRKSTRLNSSHLVISYAVFCLKKKKKQKLNLPRECN